jgi:hypothetical protein
MEEGLPREVSKPWGASCGLRTPAPSGALQSQIPSTANLEGTPEGTKLG